MGAILSIIIDVGIVNYEIYDTSIFRPKPKHVWHNIA